MTIIQTSYPVFESGQVLTSGHLNDLVEYLEQTDRLTRNKLVGIGIVCGFEVCYEPTPNQIRLSAGCAVTSKGYLIVQDECLLDRVLAYTLPVPSLEEATLGQIEEARYEFFHTGNGNRDGDQVELWELYATDYTAPPGESEPTSVDAAFLSDKVLLLYFECNLESLKNCDINDCSDKGAEMEFTLRKLLISKTDATAMLAKEQEYADRPVDRSNHPRYDLDPLLVEKINPSLYNIAYFDQLIDRILTIVDELTDPLLTALSEGYAAYEHFLLGLYPSSQFPNGPFGNEGFPELVFTDYSENFFLAQYLYDCWRDIAESHNEFIAEACRLEAECCPSDARFPKHVLIGELQETPSAFAVTIDDPTEASSFDPLSAQSGLGPKTTPAAFRHHFVPSTLYDQGAERLQLVRSLHYRTYLLAYRYDTRDLENADIRITPSKEGDYALSDKAMPFYYGFATGDDLHRNWSYPKTVKNALEAVYSHQLMTEEDHPLKLRLDDHNFYRVEGILGKPLGTVFDELIRQKRALGLSFGIEPVYLGVASGGDAANELLNDRARAGASSALLKLLLCRMRDLDVIFLVLMAALFYYLYYILTLLGRLAIGDFQRDAGGDDGGDGDGDGGGGGGFRARTGESVFKFDLDRNITESVLGVLRPQDYDKGVLTQLVTKDVETEDVLGVFYARVQNTSPTDNLFDRTVAVAIELDLGLSDEVINKQFYPAVSLIDKTESLVALVSAPSIDAFDFDAFETGYADFSRTFDTYITAMSDVEFEPDSEYADANEKLTGAYGAVAASGPQVLVANLASELQERVEAIFEELLLEGYAQRHPGMEHKAGAPRGGTLVLLYAHRETLIEVVEREQSRIDLRINEALARSARAGWTFATGRPPIKLGPDGSADEPLNDYVVVADFCVPYLCCDSDCSEIEISGEEDDRDEPDGPRGPDDPEIPGNVTGDILDAETGESVTNAEVTATHVDTGPVDVSVGLGQYSFQAEPGAVTVTATSPDHLPQTKPVTVESDGKHQLDFTLEQVRDDRQPPGFVRGDILDAENDEFVNDAEVTATHVDTGPVNVSASMGQYFIQAEPGEVSVVATSPEHLPQTKPVTVESAGNHQLDFALEQIRDDPQQPEDPGAVRGVVRDAETGEFVNDAEVTATRVDSGQNIAVQIDDQNYRFETDPGAVEVTADSPDHMPMTLSVEVISNQEQPLDFALRREPGSVFGLVLDETTRERIGNAEVTARRVDTGQAIDVEFANGEYKFETDPDAVEVTATSPDHVPLTLPVEVVSNEAQPLDFELRRQEQNEPVRVTIRLLDLNERPIRGATIVVMHSDGTQPPVRPTGQGYVFDAATGVYLVEITAEGFQAFRDEILVTNEATSHRIMLESN